MKFTSLIFVVLSTVLVAQSPTKPAISASKPDAKAKPPVISDALKKDFYKAQLELKQAQEVFSQKQQAAQIAAVEITKACGSDFDPQLDPKINEPVCVEKPKPAEPAKK